MKLKELQKTVNIAWSTAQQQSIYLAAGTAAQQFDSNANSTIELYSPNLTDSSYDMQLKCSVSSPYKFQKVIWGCADAAHNNGLIVGGCEGGHILIYSPAKMLAHEEALIHQQGQHTGVVSGLDLNPFQTHLLASCASESEIFIWDLNNPTVRMNPGAKTQPLEDVKNVAWNRQVQHILASVFNTRCVIWDLRKSEQIIKLSDVQSRVRWHSLQWHPEAATQIWLASEDDQAPVVQMWDLRYATAPAKTMQIHQRGMLEMSWCAQDTDLMVSCGKDNRIYCWNPNTTLTEGEILSEVATTASWYSDVQWCPRNPAIIASSSLDGNVSVYSLFGGTQKVVQTANKIADSFPGMDQFSQAPIAQQTSQIVYHDLKRPPKWLRRPCGIAFGFGGKLISFNSKSKTITLYQIATEAELVERANALEKSLVENNIVDYCRKRADEMLDQNSRLLWNFIKASFESNAKDEVLNLLGYNNDDIERKFGQYINKEYQEPPPNVEAVEKALRDNVLSDISAYSEVRNESSQNSKPHFKVPDSEDEHGLIAEAILTGNMEAAVELCFQAKRPADALVIASTIGIDFLTKTQFRYLEQQKENELTHVVTALLRRDWFNFIKSCPIDSWKQAFAAGLTHSEHDFSKICEALGDRLACEGIESAARSQKALLCYIYSGCVEKIICTWYQWKKMEQNCAHYKLNAAELQDLAEVAILIAKRFEDKLTNCEQNETAIKFLMEYIEFLASQGALNAASHFYTILASKTKHTALEALGNRIYCSLHGQEPLNISKRNQLTQQNSNQPSHFQSSGMDGVNQNFKLQNTRMQFVPNASANSQQPYFGHNSNTVAPQTQFINNAWPSAMTQGSSYAPLNNQNPVSHIPSEPIPATTKSPMPPPPMPNNSLGAQSTEQPPQQYDAMLQQPARPLSNASSHGSAAIASGSILHRSKYVIDPSVGTSTVNEPFAYGTSYNTAPTAPSIGHPTEGVNLYNPNVMPAQAQFNPPQFIGNNFTPTQAVMEPAAVSQAPFQNIQRNPTPPPGWNDPPALKPSSRKAKQPDTIAAPIKQPLYGMTPSNMTSSVSQTQHSMQAQQGIWRDQNQNQNQDGHQSAQVGVLYNQYPATPNNNPQESAIQNSQAGLHYGKQQTQYQPWQQQQQQQAQLQQPQLQQPQQQQSFPSGQWNTQLQPAQSQFVPTPTPVLTSSSVPSGVSQRTEPAKQKRPLPEEYTYLQTVLEELKAQCLAVAADQRTKRKFTDVTKRLESLYDCLTDGRLAAATTAALNEMVQSIQINDYAKALEIQRRIAFGPDFSQCSDFLPGLKVLVQSAIDLHVYLR